MMRLLSVGDPVVRQRRVRPGGRDGLEAGAAVQRIAGPLAIEPRRRLALGDVAPAEFLLQPAQEAAHGGAVAALGIARSGQLDRVLAGLGQHAGLVALDHPGAGGLERLQHLRAGDLRVDQDGAARGADLPERVLEALDRLDRHAVAEVLAGLQLAWIDEQLDPAIGVQEREAQEQRIERHVAAAGVEEPGDRIGRRDRRRPRRRPPPP